MAVSRQCLAVAALGLAVMGTLWAQRDRLRDFIEEEDNPAPFPADGNERTEFVFARLRYMPKRNGYFGRGGGSWATDYPKADRQFVQGVRRLTRIHTRSVEQVIEIDNDELFNHPWIYATEVGRWDFTERQAARLREYMLKGGFIMTDDFHGTFEWQVFMEGMRKLFPDRTVSDLQNSDEIFHVLYDLDDRMQVPGIQMFFTNQIWENDGFEARWRAIHDDRGRIMMGICHNMDIGDAWEWADHPMYPEKYASMAYRIGVNYIIYAMTH